MRAKLDALYAEEVVPVFAAIGMGDEARAYLKTVIERFSNPFLDHRLSEIFTNHEAKMRRRFGGLIELANTSEARVNLPPPKAALPDGWHDTRSPRRGRPDRRAPFRLCQGRRQRGRLERGGGTLRASARARAPLGGRLVCTRGSAREAGRPRRGCTCLSRNARRRSRRCARGGGAARAHGTRRSVRRTVAGLYRAPLRRLCLAVRQASH